MKYLFLSMCVLILISCSQKSNSNYIDHLKVDVSTAESNLKFSSIVSNIDLVALETTPESLIGRVDKVLVSDDYIFVLDIYSAKSLFMFNKKGKFLRKIGARGKGPSEYREIFDFIIDGESVKILDTGVDIVTYDFSSNFVERSKLDKFSAVKFERNEKGGYAFITGGTEDNLLITDSDLDKKNSYFPFVDRKRNKIINNPLYKKDGRIIYRKPYKDTLYSISENGTLSRYKYLDYSGKNFVADAASKVSENDLYDFCVTKLFYETQDLEYLVFIYEDTPWIFINFNRAKSSILFKYTDLINDVTFESKSTYVVCSDGKDKLIYLIQPPYLKEAMQSVGDKSRSPFIDKVKSFSQTVDFEDNPILMFLKHKPYEDE